MKSNNLIADQAIIPRINNSLLRDTLMVFGGVLLIAFLAQLRILLPFSPVPITGQTLGLLLSAAVLGARRGLITIVLYLAIGITGTPFFAGGVGMAIFKGVTAGYLLGFIPSALIVGFLFEKGWGKKYHMAFLALLIGGISVLLFGTLWLTLILGYSKAFTMGFLPFIPGELIKITIVTFLLPTVWKFTNNDTNTD